MDDGYMPSWEELHKQLIEAYNERIALRTEVNKVKSENSQMKVMIDMLELRRYNAQKELKNANETIGRLETEIKSLKLMNKIYEKVLLKLDIKDNP